MRLQKITAPGGQVRFAASAAEARTARLALAELLDIGKLKISITPVEVSTKKPDLIAALNAIASGAQLSNAPSDGDDDEGDNE